MEPKVKLRHELGRRFGEKQNNLSETSWHATLGDGNGNVAVANTPGYAYCVVEAHGLAQVYNARAPFIDGLSVIVGYDPTMPELLQVLSVHGGTVQEINVSTSAGGANKHGWTHTYPSQDWMDVYLDQIPNLRVDPISSASPLVRVNPGLVWTGNGYAVVGASSLNLSPYVPVQSGSACMLLISANTSGSVVLTAGATMPVTTGALAMMPAPPSNTAKVLAAIRLYNTMVYVRRAITDTDINDLRFSDLTGSVSTYDGVISAIGSASSAGTSGSAARGDHTHRLPIGAGLAWVGNNLTGLPYTLAGAAQGDTLSYQTSSGSFKNYPLGLGVNLTNDGNEIRIGAASSDYVKVDGYTGYLRLSGSATAFDDLRIEDTSVRKASVAPTEDAGFRGNANFLALNFSNSTADEVQFNVQMPHSWREGSTIYPHVHFSPWAVSAGSAAAQFRLEYYSANVGDVFSAASGSLNLTETWYGDGQWRHYIATSASGLDMTNVTLSSILKCRLYRDNTVTNNYANKISFLYFDIHYEIDSFGSDEEYIKDASYLITDTDGQRLTSSDNQELLDSQAI